MTPSAETLITLILFLTYTIIIIATLLYISSIAAAILLITTPLLLLLILPEQTAAFLSHKQLTIIDNTVPIYNLHLLLFIETGLLCIICYSEFITWYLTAQNTRQKKTGKKNKQPPSPNKTKAPGKQVNIPFKPLENLLIKLENLLSKK